MALYFRESALAQQHGRQQQQAPSVSSSSVSPQMPPAATSTTSPSFNAASLLLPTPTAAGAVAPFLLPPFRFPPVGNVAAGGLGLPIPMLNFAGFSFPRYLHTY